MFRIFKDLKHIIMNQKLLLFPQKHARSHVN